MLQISAEPRCPAFSDARITSGAMYLVDISPCCEPEEPTYIGVPASEFITAGPSPPPGTFDLIARVLAIVRFPFAITLAAPKSTYLMIEFVPSRISGRQRYSKDRGLTFRLHVPVFDPL